MFSGALTMAAIVRWPSVVVPRSTILTRSDCDGDELEVLLDAVGRGELPIGAHAKAEVILRATATCALDARSVDARADERARQRRLAASFTLRMISERSRTGTVAMTGSNAHRGDQVFRRAMVAPRCDARVVPELHAPADGGRAPPARCRAARRVRGRGRAALREALRRPRRSRTPRRPTGCRAARRHEGRVRLDRNVMHAACDASLPQGPRTKVCDLSTGRA